MADCHVWLRCCGCGKTNSGVIRLISFSGTWGPWNKGIDNFIVEHMTEKCHGKHIYFYNEVPEYKFFELVYPSIADKEGWWPMFRKTKN